MVLLELGGGHFFGLVVDVVLTVLHDLEDGFIDAIEAEGLGLKDGIDFVGLILVLDVHELI